MATNTSQPQGVLHVTDSRTGRAYELPIVDGAIRAIDLRQIKVSDDDFGLLAYDPAFMNTANCRRRSNPPPGRMRSPSTRSCTRT